MAGAELGPGGPACAARPPGVLPDAGTTDSPSVGTGRGPGLGHRRRGAEGRTPVIIIELSDCRVASCIAAGQTEHRWEWERPTIRELLRVQETLGMDPD